MASLTANLGEMREEIKKNIRIIRDIQITSTKFTTLIDEGAKIPSTIMNAFGAVDDENLDDPTSIPLPIFTEHY